MRVVLLVPHKGEPKMAGKLFEQGDGETHIFLHETSQRQHHIKTDSPGGIDQVVLDWLDGLPFPVVVDFKIKEDGSLYRAYPKVFYQYGLQEVSDGRCRFYLPVKFWGTLSKQSYAIPWITNRKVLEEPAWLPDKALPASKSTRRTSRTPSTSSLMSAPDSGIKQLRLDDQPK